MLLEQVARMAEAPQVKRGDASINGDPGVVLTVTKQPHADTRAADRPRSVPRCEKSSRRCPPTWSLETDLFQLRDFIDRGIYNVGEALVDRGRAGAHRAVPVPAQLPHHVHLADGHPAVAGRHGAGVPAGRLADRHANCRST